VIIFACDLDNTLIHSYKVAQKEDVCVEMNANKELSFMTQKSCNLLMQIVKLVIFAPVTTRSLEQYRRISLFNGYYPEFSLVSNGGILLINNQIDQEWYTDSKLIALEAKEELNKCLEILSKDENRIFNIRFVDDLFVYTKSRNAQKTMDILLSYVDKQKVYIDNNNEKIYAVPVGLNKGNAIMRLKNKLIIDELICAGDSKFDASMLNVADIAITLKTNVKYLTNINGLITPKDNKNFSEFVLTTVMERIGLDLGSFC